MESSGDFVLPVKSIMSFEENCGYLQIQVIGRIPDAIAHRSRGKIFSSFRPSLHIKTSKMEEINTPEFSITDFSKFSSIQDALDTFPVWETVLIPEGMYFETLNITKPVKLVGSRRTILFGNIQILSHDVTLDGFTIYSLEVLKPTVEIISSFNVIIQNSKLEQGIYSNSDLLMRNTCAVSVFNSSRVHIVNSRVVNYGISLDVQSSKECVIQSNWIQSSWIALRVSESEDIIVVRNYMRENLMLISLINQTGKQDTLTSLVEKNILEDNIHLTDELETLSRKIFSNSIQDKVLEEVKVDPTVIITGSCLGGMDEVEPCAFYRTGRQTIML